MSSSDESEDDFESAESNEESSSDDNIANEDLTAGISASHCPEKQSDELNNELPNVSVLLNTKLIIPPHELKGSELKVDTLNSSTTYLDNFKMNLKADGKRAKSVSTSPMHHQASDLLTTDSKDDTTKIDKISARNIPSSNPKRLKSTKPSNLGAKKLGGIKLSSESSSDAVGPILANLELAAVDTFPSNINSSSIIESHGQVTETQLKQTQNQDAGSGRWGWFVQPTSLLSSVSSLTNQILSTVENGLNIPEPEDLAKEEALFAGKTPEEMKSQKDDSNATGFNQLIGGMGNLSHFIENTGTSIFSTGLNTLESLGKKTINVLQQTDPGLKRTKAALINPLQVSQDRPCLSLVLREAREVKEIEKLIDTTDSTTLNTNQFSTPTLAELFENHHGLVHLEALEMLSQQYQARVVSQIRRLTTQRKNLVEEVVKLCSFDSNFLEKNDNTDDFDLELLEHSLIAYFDRINLTVTLKKLIESFRRGFNSNNTDGSDVKEIHLRSLDSLASVTSSGVELMHKSCELLSMSPKSTNPTLSGRLEAETFSKVTKLVCSELIKLGRYYANQIIKVEIPGHTTNYSTDIIYKACISYLQNALKLSVPILQSRFF